MDKAISSKEERAAGRRDWPVRRFDLGHEPEDDLRSDTTAEERLAMMWGLACRAWALSGRPMPEYERHAAPGRVGPTEW